MSRKITGLEGKVFGKLTVIKQERNPSNNILSWYCKCECGNYTYTTAYNLISGKARSCGCLIKERASQVHSKDLVGKKFGRLTVLHRADPWYTAGGIPQVRYVCKCDCGNEVTVFAGNLKKKNTQSCGCYNRQAISERELIDLTGKKFGKLTVIRRDEDYVSPSGNKTAKWYCKCDCGNYISVNGTSLREGYTRSCGCIRNSYGESVINDYLKQHKINFQKEYSFDDLVSSKNYKLRFDFAIFNSKSELLALIEFQGPQHYSDSFYSDSDFGRQQREETDDLKREYCRENHLLLYEIRYDADIESELDWLLQVLIDVDMPIMCQDAIA